MKKNHPVPAQNTELTKNYTNLLQELQSILDTGLHTAYKAVDNIKVQTYWQLGERIVREELKYKDRAEYGKYLVEKLAVDLDLRRQRLYEFIQFYKTYPIVRALHGQLSWYHYLELIKLDSEKKRLFYEQKIIQHSWSYRKLRDQIKSKLYENTSPEEIKKTLRTKLTIPETSEVFKKVYDFKFAELLPSDNEKTLENTLVNNVVKFLQELGEYFSFCGQQVPITIDGKTHKIDLVVYNRAIPCNILIDLKIGKITSDNIGQMNKYVSYWRKKRQFPHDKNTIGLIIGKAAGKEEIEFALDKLEKQIFVATYQTRLPSDEKLKKAVGKLL